MSENNSASLYDFIFSGSPDAMAIADAQTGILLKINSSMETLTGWSADELIGRHQKILHPELVQDHGVSLNPCSMLPKTYTSV